MDGTCVKIKSTVKQIILFLSLLFFTDKNLFRKLNNITKEYPPSSDDISDGRQSNRNDSVHVV